MEYKTIVSDKYCLNKETSKFDLLLLVNYHLHGKMTEYYNDEYKQSVNPHPWYYTAEYTDGLAQTDTGLVVNLKSEAGGNID